MQYEIWYSFLPHNKIQWQVSNSWIYVSAAVVNITIKQMISLACECVHTKTK